MEDKERELIRSRLTSLISHIRCTDEFLWFFYEKRILTPSEIQEIDGKSVDAEKASTFLRIIKTRINGFAVLKEGLLKFKQSGALNVLEGREEINSKITLEETQSRISNLSFRREELNSELTLWKMQSQIFISMCIVSISLLVYLFFEQPTASQKRNISVDDPPPVFSITETSTPLTYSSLSEISSKTNIKFDVVQPVLSFTGRTKELEQLHQMILRSRGAERVSVVSLTTLVTGLGGIGKTQLAREYVRINVKEFDGNVLWMNAESEESLSDSFKRLAWEKLNLSTKDENGREMPAKSIAEAVYNYFVGMKALFVLDNAEKVPWLKQFMPQIENTHNLFFLITSRDREWDRGIEILSLDGLVGDEAVDLIQKGLKIDANDPVQTESVRNLAQNLQCFPLAMQQAIAYIIAQRRMHSDYSADTYLEEFKIKQLELLDYREENAISVDIYTATTATTWTMTIDKIKEDPSHGALASLILNVIAYLGADNIRRDLFYQLRPKIHWFNLAFLNVASYFGMLNKQGQLLHFVFSIAEIDLVKQDQTNAAVKLLVKYSILNGREGHSILSVHRLVQSATRNQLARDGMEQMLLDIAIYLLQGSDENEFPAENIGHALIVWRHAFAHNQIIQTHAWQVHRILWKMIKVGQHEEGVRFGNEALEKLKKVFGEDHFECLRIQRSIGLILNRQGYVDKAISVFQDILTKAKSKYGEDSEISLLTKADLGISLRRRGKYKEALKILREVLKKKKTIFVDNHSSTLATEESYGLALMESGNLTEAEKIFQRILQIFSEGRDVKSTDVLNLQINLSTIYSKRGEYEKALEISREVYKKLSPVWTENVDLFAVACFNLGYSLSKIGKHEEALKILEGSFEKIKERMGSQHARTLEIQQEIGTCYQSLGNLSKAHVIFQSVHQAFVSLFGEDSLDALDASEYVAISLSLLGEHSKALSKFQEIVPKVETLLGNESLPAIQIKREFALAIERTAENLHTALDLLKQAKASMIPIVGEDAPIVEKITNDIKRIEKTRETS